jgi:hypothetical protein
MEYIQYDVNQVLKDYLLSEYGEDIDLVTDLLSEEEKALLHINEYED